MSAGIELSFAVRENLSIGRPHLIVGRDTSKGRRFCLGLLQGNNTSSSSKKPLSALTVLALQVGFGGALVFVTDVVIRLANRLHRVDASGPASRNIAGGGDREEQTRDADERSGVGGADAEQQALQESRKRESSRHAEDDSRDRQNQTLPQDQAQNVGILSSERAPDSNLLRSLHN
jgi:hypothetical protein